MSLAFQTRLQQPDRETVPDDFSSAPIKVKDAENPERRLLEGAGHVVTSHCWNIVPFSWFEGGMERQMHQGSDRRALMIYIGAIMLVGLLIVLGAALSWSSSGRSGEQAQISREADP